MTVLVSTLSIITVLSSGVCRNCVSVAVESKPLLLTVICVSSFFDRTSDCGMMDAKLSVFFCGFWLSNVRRLMSLSPLYSIIVWVTIF